MKRLILPAAVAALFLPTPLALSALPASATPVTCRGLEATHVGTPSQALTTTPGPDVVVTNGADEVTTLNGDDVICVTGDVFVHVVPGGDDDIVDAREFEGEALETSLGQYGVDDSSGDDVYLGGGQGDQVFVSSGRSGDTKTIRLDGGDDYLNVAPDYPGKVYGHLGKGRDEYWNGLPRPGVVVDAAKGRDVLRTVCQGCGGFEAYLRTGALKVDGDPAGQAHGIEDVDLVRFGGPVVDFALVWGTDGRNVIAVTACTAGLRGRGGDDTISVTRGNCDEIGGGLIGGEGDDVLVGGRGPDVLRGGQGDDEADGGSGSDLCRAEVVRECEL